MIFLQTTTVRVAHSESVFDIMMKGGWILIPIFLMSLAAVYYIIERYTLIRSASKIDNALLEKISKLIREKNYTEALKLSQQYNHPIGRVLAAGLENPNRDIKDIEQIMADEAKSEAFFARATFGLYWHCCYYCSNVRIFGNYFWGN